MISKHNPPAATRKVWSLAARWGVMKALPAMVMTLVRPWLLFSQVRARKAQDMATDAQPPEGIVIRIATRAELERACTEMPDQLSVAFVDAALKRGDVCAAAFAGESMAAFNWTSFRSAPVNNRVEVHIQPPYRYGYKLYTRPEYRGRRIAHYLGRHLESYGLKRGRTHVISYVETKNYASLANEARLGSRCVGYAGYIYCFGKVFTFRSSGAKAHGFRFSIAEPEAGNEIAARSEVEPAASPET